MPEDASAGTQAEALGGVSASFSVPMTQILAWLFYLPASIMVNWRQQSDPVNWIKEDIQKGYIDKATFSAIWSKSTWVQYESHIQRNQLPMFPRKTRLAGWLHCNLTLNPWTAMTLSPVKQLFRASPDNWQRRLTALALRFWKHPAKYDKISCLSLPLLLYRTNFVAGISFKFPPLCPAKCNSFPAKELPLKSVCSLHLLFFPLRLYRFKQQPLSPPGSGTEVVFWPAALIRTFCCAPGFSAAIFLQIWRHSMRLL